jgi:hypothetical protein
MKFSMTKIFCFILPFVVLGWIATWYGMSREISKFSNRKAGYIPIRILDGTKPMKAVSVTGLWLMEPTVSYQEEVNHITYQWLSSGEKGVDNRIFIKIESGETGVIPVSFGYNSEIVMTKEGDQLVVQVK